MTASMIPTNAPTVLPGGQQVTGDSPGIPQAGTRPTPRTSKGSGVYGKPGPAPEIAQPIRDYVVILRNDSDHEFRMRYLTVDYLIAAHDELVVPWEVMVSFLGSPDVQNLGPRRMDRKQVFDKLRVKYGAYHDDAIWNQQKPRITAWRVTGERLITVVDDPEGLSITPSSISQQDQLATNAQIALLTQQLEATQRLVAQMSGQSQSVAPIGVEVPDPTERLQPLQDAPLAPEAPEPTVETFAQGAAGVTQGNIPPPPVPSMTPQMPIQPVPLPQNPPAGLPSEVVGGGATPDTPPNQVRIG